MDRFHLNSRVSSKIPDHLVKSLFQPIFRICLIRVD
jgi:hypothetical protein